MWAECRGCTAQEDVSLLEEILTVMYWYPLVCPDLACPGPCERNEQPCIPWCLPACSHLSKSATVLKALKDPVWQ